MPRQKKLFYGTCTVNRAVRHCSQWHFTGLRQPAFRCSPYLGSTHAPQRRTSGWMGLLMRIVSFIF